MDLALPRHADPARKPGAREAAPARPAPADIGQECGDSERRHEAGVSPGVNIRPGSDDDGWVVPDPVTLADGTRVQLYKDGEALHVAYDAIAAAKFLICLEVYIFANDDTGKAFTDLLCRKAREGVRVYVLYDDLGSLGAGELFKRLAAAGVRLASFHPVLPWELKFSWRPWNRDHRKLLVIDNHTAGMGGLNIGGNYAGSWVVKNVRKLRRAVGSGAVRVGGSAPTGPSPDGSPSPECDYWRDTAIGFRGPGAKLLQQAFARVWTYITRGGRIHRAEFMHGLDGTSGDLGILASVPTVSSPLRPLLCNLMRGAR